MERIIKIGKINLISILAFPLLLLATAAKLLAKAMEKLVTIVGIVFIVGAIAIAFELGKSPKAALDGILTVIICVIVGGIFSALIIWILTMVSNVIITGAALAIKLMNGLYTLIYSGYTVLYHICKKDYAKISGDGTPLLNGLCCIFFTLLCVVNRAIIFFVTHAVKILVLCSMVLMINSLLEMNKSTQAVFGINLFGYLGLFPIYDIINGVVLYLAVMLGIIVLFLSLGMEWREWGMEMDISTFGYKDSVKDIVENRDYLSEDLLNGLQVENKEQRKRYNQYMDKWNQHLESLEGFLQQMVPVVEKSDNYLLRTVYGEYISNLQEIAEQLKKYEGAILAEDFEKMIPQIDKLEEQKKNIIKQAERAAAEQRKKSVTNGFFGGCDTEEKLEKRYKALCKTYHPDNETGDEESFKVIQEEYEKAKKKMMVKKMDK